MTVESVDSEEVQCVEAFNSDFYESSKPNWHGRCINKAPVDQYFGNIRGSISTKTNEVCCSPLRYFSPEIEISLCGEKIDGEVSASGSMDTEGNKSAEAKVEASNKDGTVSGYVSGSISQDKDGNTDGKVEAGIKAKF